ncbi:MAG: hypothetical protein BGO97_15015 [Micrococcales bacterium 70-64]|nr:DUF2510 domain-containing protein [Leifsonia sp.]ODU65219.1 MAG: hypothetical protein ABT06_15015 [Leifsonia sp. SCN 70-46]OJX86911.1 MAG: hypothetical protein BGO97_15015 [Micrococcales bacterium 70-64]
MVESGALPPAGWYPDPRDPSSRRWWDGLAWTGHVRTPEPVAVVAPAAVAVLERAEDISSAEYARRAAGYAPRAPEAEPVVAQPLSSTSIVMYGSTHTAQGWLIAVSPVWYGLLTVVVGGLTLSMSPAGGRIYVLPLLGVFITALVLLARADARRLNERGHTPPSPRWAWLPIVYLIARVVRTGAESAWLLAVYVFTQLAYVIVVVALALPLILAAAPVPQTPGAAPSDTEYPPFTAAEHDYYLTREGMEEAVRASLTDVVVDELTCTTFPQTRPGDETSCLMLAESASWEVVLRIVVADDNFPFQIVDIVQLGGGAVPDGSIDS